MSSRQDEPSGTQTFTASGATASAIEVKYDGTDTVYFKVKGNGAIVPISQTSYTSDTETTAYTATTDASGVAAKLADLNALRVAYENLRAYVEAALPRS